MSWQHALLLLAAGVAGGLTGSIAGLASVATYPALLMAGLPPVAANVTNTVALTFNTIGSVWGSLPELEGMGHWLRRVMPMAILGGAAGAALLLSLPAEGFEQVVPILLALSSLTIAIPQRRGADDEPRPLAFGADLRRDLRNLFVRRVFRRRGGRDAAGAVPARRQ